MSKSKLKRICVSVIVLVILCIVCSSAVFAEEKVESVLTKAELETKIEECENTKSIAHQMAECARALGFEESHEIIITAQLKYKEANRALKEYLKQLDELNKKLVPTWTGSKLTKRSGVNWGPTGKETYYNLKMSRVVSIMREKGYSEEEYPYWVREDGCKMLGDYIMVAANLDHYPKGTIVECSLGWAIVADTGDFAKSKDGWNWLDIAVNW